MDINIRFYFENTRKNQIFMAVDILNKIQTYFNFILEECKDVDVCTETIINWDKFCEKNFVNFGKYLIYITEKAFYDNWFSHEQSQYAVISTDTWEEHFSPPPLNVYLMYQIAQATINFVADLNEAMICRMAHNRPKGCMFDLCEYKEEIKLGMKVGIICPECKNILMGYGINEKALCSVEKIIEYVRLKSVGFSGEKREFAKYDVFISHANKDKKDFVEALYQSLKKLGVDIFYDKESLEWGDNWKDKIIKGTQNAEFAIIVISENFFDREWTERELTEFLNRQNKNGQKIILPIIHNITAEELKKKYPNVADIQAIDSKIYTCDEIALLLARRLIERYKNNSIMELFC